MNPYRRYIWAFLVAVVLGLLLVDPLAYLADSWDLKTLSRLIRRREPVVFLGDSVLYSKGQCDTDRRTIPEMTEALAGQPVLALAHAAHSPIVYRKLAPILATLHPGLRTVVIPLNLRSFSANWFTRPSYNFPRRQLLGDLIALRLSPEWLQDYARFRYGELEQIETQAWLASTIYDEEISLGRIDALHGRLHALRPIPCGGDYGDQSALIGERFAYHYGNRITPGHPMFDYIQETLDALAAHGVAAVLYLSPVNLEAIGHTGPPGLQARVRGNIDRIREVAAERGWPLIDLSGRLEDTRFVERRCACEHVDETGRQLIAREVANALPR